MRRDLTVLDADEELIVELRLLVARRRDLAVDRTCAVNRLHDQALAICPALERALDLTNRGPLVRPAGFQTPGALREIGDAGLTEWLRARRVRGAAVLAAKAINAARSQTRTLLGEQMAARLPGRLAEGVITLTEQIKDIDQLIEDRFHRHPSAEVIISLPGIGVLLGAEFPATTSGDMDRFGSADKLSGFAGVAFQPEMVLQRQDHGLDALAQPGREHFDGGLGLVVADRADQDMAQAGGGLFHSGCGEPFSSTPAAVSPSLPPRLR
jgi:hypothetical protein